jgi:hypothetical protein
MGSQWGCQGNHLKTGKVRENAKECRKQVTWKKWGPHRIGLGKLKGRLPLEIWGHRGDSVHCWRGLRSQRDQAFPCSWPLVSDWYL